MPKVQVLSWPRCAVVLAIFHNKSKYALPEIYVRIVLLSIASNEIPDRVPIILRHGLGCGMVRQTRS